MRAAIQFGRTLTKIRRILDYCRMLMRNLNSIHVEIILRLFNFPSCEYSELRPKFIEMVQGLGIEVHESDINIIHHLPSSSAQKHVIVKLIDRHLRKAK